MPLEKPDFETVFTVAIDNQGVWTGQSTFRRDELVVDQRGDLDSYFLYFGSFPKVTFRPLPLVCLI